MKFYPVVPEICRGQVHGARKERRITRTRTRTRIIIIRRRNGAKTISLQTLFGRLNKSSWRYDGLTVLPVRQFTASDYLLSNLINIRVKKNSKKFTGPGPVSTRNLLVLNIGMKEIKFVGNKINLLVTEWHILFKRTILGWQFNSWSDAAVHLLFILSWAIKVNFRILLVFLNKVLLSFFLIWTCSHETSVARSI